MDDRRTGLIDHRRGYLGLLFYPFYAIAARVLIRAKVRFLDVHIWALEDVGQLAMDFDTYLKENVLSDRKVFPVLLCLGRKPANEALLAHWSKHIRVIRGRWINELLRPLMTFPELVDSIPAYSIVHRGAAGNHGVIGQWADRAPLLHLSADENARGEAQLRALGIPEGAWFVCVHSREGGFKPVHDWAHSFRNSSILDYAEAMREIVARGGWCVRMGDATMQPLPPMAGVVDYPHSPSKSDWMDVFLCARCRFFLGNTSGLFIVAGIFGRPSALANKAPLGATYSIFPADISIPKLLMDAEGRTIPFAEAFADVASEYHLATEFAERGLKHIDNTPREIAELAMEMLDRLDGRVAEEADDADLQARFRAYVQPHHYCWPAPGRIGRGFLRRHRDLLGESSQRPEDAAGRSINRGGSPIPVFST
ncbi:MAG: TIGR04372 family glycosyltransferase [Methylocystis sp.]